MSEVEAEIEGDIEAQMRAAVSDLGRDLGRVVVEETDRVRQALRDDTRAALGDEVARAWRSRTYGIGGLSPAGYVWSRAPEIVAGHAGATIRARNSSWLAVPTREVAWRGGDNARFQRRGPADVAGLRLVPLGPSRMLLVERGPSAPGRRSRVMFVLVRAVTLRRRLAWEDIMTEAGRRFADRVAAAGGRAA